MSTSHSALERERVQLKSWRSKLCFSLYKQKNVLKIKREENLFVNISVQTQEQEKSNDNETLKTMKIIEM